ncbi:recombinase family protein [Streptomyces sp. F63]|uniref:recombinase family protein n=1 Tax=Streptomyces sp. F63 TaxID=2824887 RepID=UPI001B37D6C3|nr:recombinase family protein [Streptomyces sp. F63]MBQ0986374.1 recombinase family protein [Streptomyces sp. F63]
MTQLRALSAIRLSVRTDETTSPARQRAANSNEAARRGAVIVGEAEDLDVSATKTTPFDRPELGAWLQRPDDFDMIIWWRMDRAVRSMSDMAELGRWAKAHGKLLVFAEGPGGAPMDLDMRTVSPVSELITTLLAFSAQMESTAIRERVTGAQAALRSQGRYSGGLVPFGYEKIPNPDGPGYKLAPEPEAVKILSGIIRDVLNGQALTSIALALNDAGVLVPRDYQAAKAGRQTGGVRNGQRHNRFRWTAGALSKILRSPALMGYRIHNRKPVRDSDGRPVLIGEPILSREEFDTLQECLDVRKPQKSRTRRDTKALLLGVAKCSSCGGNMYRADRIGGADYICRASARGARCTSAAGMRADWLEQYAEAEFLARIGDTQIMKVVTRKGYDPTPELREVEAELRALYADKETRKSRTGRMIWQEEVATLERRAEALEATPRTEAQTEIVPTGETYASFWARHDTAGRRQLLLDAGARVTVTKGRTGGGAERLAGPDLSRLSFAIGAHDDPQAARLEEIAAEEDAAALF